MVQNGDMNECNVAKTKSTATLKIVVFVQKRAKKVMLQLLDYHS